MPHRCAPGDHTRRELAALGPVSVKIGQTLSQRPDILPEDVCLALKALQTNNKPFPDVEAFEARRERVPGDRSRAPATSRGAILLSQRV